MKLTVLLPVVLTAFGCGARPEAPADPSLLAEIQNIRAIDSHAHPVRFTPNSEPADRDFDALPVENMEPFSVPVPMRPGARATVEASRRETGAP